MIDCSQKERREICTSKYECQRRGKCYECIKCHLKMNQLPGYAFVKTSKEAEQSYKRDFGYIARSVINK